MQLPSEVIQPSFYLFLFKEMVSVVQPVSTQLDCERDVDETLLLSSLDHIGLKVTEIRKPFQLRGSSLQLMNKLIIFF